jgi:hypothetical protein
MLDALDFPLVAHNPAQPAFGRPLALYSRRRHVWRPVKFIHRLEDLSSGLSANLGS